MLNLIFAESALEMVPKPLLNHPSVINRAKALRKNPGDTFLDRTYHHRAMLQLENSERRGRPDILHFALLEALGTPLNREGLLRVYIHTMSNHIISIDSEVRLPKNYNRFLGLIMQLYREGKVPLAGKPLLKLKKGVIREVLSEIKPSYTIIFSRKGKTKTLEDAVEVLSKSSNPLAVIGCFPKGNVSEEIIKLADTSISIDSEMLEVWTVTSRLIYEFEKQIGLPEKRLNK